MIDDVLAADADEADLVLFHTAGGEAAGEYTCARCGYGVTLKTILPLCPMCGCESWERLFR